MVIIEEAPSDLSLKLKEHYPNAHIFGTEVTIEADSASEIASLFEFFVKMGYKKVITIKNAGY